MNENIKRTGRYQTKNIMMTINEHVHIKLGKQDTINNHKYK